MKTCETQTYGFSVCQLFQCFQETYSNSTGTSKMVHFAKTSILDVQLGSEYAFVFTLVVSVSKYPCRSKIQIQSLCFKYAAFLWSIHSQYLKSEIYGIERINLQVHLCSSIFKVINSRRPLKLLSRSLENVSCRQG